jgi:hypothetical protein
MSASDLSAKSREIMASGALPIGPWPRQDRLNGRDDRSPCLLSLRSITATRRPLLQTGAPRQSGKPAPPCGS